MCIHAQRFPPRQWLHIAYIAKPRVSSCQHDHHHYNQENHQPTKLSKSFQPKMNKPTNKETNERFQWSGEHGMNLFAVYVHGFHVGKMPLMMTKNYKKDKCYFFEQKCGSSYTILCGQTVVSTRHDMLAPNLFSWNQFVRTKTTIFATTSSYSCHTHDVPACMHVMTPNLLLLVRSSSWHGMVTLVTNCCCHHRWIW